LHDSKRGLSRAIACGSGYGCRNKITDRYMAKPSRPRRGKPQGRSGGASNLYAALDLGTNNCRLLIAERTPSGGLRVVDSFSQIVTLGEGLASSGVLSEKAQGRAIEALRRCAEKVKKHRPVRGRYIATQACRAASNGRNFLSEASQKVGLRMELISPKEEAKFALLGSLDLVDPANDFALVIDIGGGSTELCWIDAKAAVERGIRGCATRPPILGWASFPVGVVTLADMFGTGTEHYEDMLAHVRSLMEANDAASRFGPLFRAGRGQLIGNSGTVTSLAGVHLGLPRYIRSAVDGIWVERAALEGTMQRLALATAEERAREPCLVGGRSDLMVPGIAILAAVCATWPADRLRVGDRGLREGIILSLMHGHNGGGQQQRRRNRPRRRPAAGGSGSDAPSTGGKETAS
jgi:exopolyphosphatase/guanosine-5'-triphosphate,3'-diphosphate pyrophosphatase